jgi:hypothetical protein
MTKKHLFLLLLLVLGQVSARAQAAISWSDTVSVHEWSDLTAIIHQDANGFVLYRFKNWSRKEREHALVYAVERYDAAMRLKAKYLVPMRKTKRLDEPRVRDIVYFGGSPVLIYEQFNIKSRIYSFYTQRLHAESLEPVGEKIFFWKGESNEFLDHVLSFVPNQDSSELLFVGFAKKYHKLLFGVIGADQQLKWSGVRKTKDQLLPLEYPNRKKGFQYALSPNAGVEPLGLDDFRVVFKGGEIAILYKKYLSREQSREAGRNSRFGYAKGHFILRVRDKGMDMQETWVNPGNDYTVQTMDIQPRPDGSLQCIGSWSWHADQEPVISTSKAASPQLQYRVDYSGHLGGVFRLNFGPEGQLTDIVVSPVPPLLQKHTAYLDKHSVHQYNREGKSAKDSDYRRVEAADVVYFPDGGTALFYEVRSTQMSGLLFNSEDIWSDIIIVRMAPDGKAVWANVVPKLQELMDRKKERTLHASFCVLREEERLHLFYLESLKPEAALQWVSLDAQGSMHIHKPLDIGASGVSPIPGAAIQIGPKTLLLPAELETTARIGLLKL